MTTKVLRNVAAALALEGLEIMSCVAGGRHLKIFARHPPSGNSGLIVVHLGSKIKSRQPASIRSEARSIRRGTYQATT